ncbi:MULTISPECIES: sulfite exporter TauE/SafE family protein [unclassified Neptuniibacter]|uniref:sulfite exporter TauE/SafE family protein n=1 Tax=unclassified Neptuniibacter TaxID=2630693 RepID=UPI000C415898|nr:MULTISPECIES: sulfite exporter TauE/SafE family protein [unclassified Neptuniibacter]MAY41321.1 cytochrome biogenesis protein [Oceanospirillaceae bacterium]|tara:strand:+ start:20037 stop:20699 length:663 start_codon:yes stop_codon:yes gene_type:complete
MTEALSLPTAFILGLLGGTHCLGMCGGIATTVSLSNPNGTKGFGLLLGYNSGRILSYTLAGALLGSLSWLVENQTIQLALRTFAGIMLICMGLYIAQWWQGLTKIEHAGGMIWKKISPLASKLLPVRNISQALLLGVLWGWLPCGLVYSTLIWASAASDWTLSAQLMAAFGLGTLPTMLLTGVLAQQVKVILQKQLTKYISGSIIILMGIYTIPWQGMIR